MDSNSKQPEKPHPVKSRPKIIKRMITKMKSPLSSSRKPLKPLMPVKTIEMQIVNNTQTIQVNNIESATNVKQVQVGLMTVGKVEKMKAQIPVKIQTQSVSVESVAIPIKSQTIEPPKPPPINVIERVGSSANTVKVKKPSKLIIKSTEELSKHKETIRKEMMKEKNLQKALQVKRMETMRYLKKGSPKRICPSCSQEAEDTFCGSCGTKIESSEQKENTVIKNDMICTSCGEEGSDPFCANCGEKLVLKSVYESDTLEELNQENEEELMEEIIEDEFEEIVESSESG